MKAVFLDLDGVIVDSIQECCEVSLLTYWGFGPLPESGGACRRLFRAARGLVGPAREFLFLQDAVAVCLADPAASLAEAFLAAKRGRDPGEVDRFEAMFFACRAFLRRDAARWFGLHALTAFGQSLVGRDLPRHYIVTTKDEESARLLLGHFGITVADVFGRDDFKRYGDKGALIAAVMDEHGYDEAEFVDDNQDHLDAVKDPRVRLVFADWGYGGLLGQPVDKGGEA